MEHDRLKKYWQGPLLLQTLKTTATDILENINMSNSSTLNGFRDDSVN